MNRTRLSWIAANAVGMAVGAAIITGLAGTLNRVLNDPYGPMMDASADLAARLLLGGAILGLSVGLAHWLALRSRMRGAGRWSLGTKFALSGHRLPLTDERPASITLCRTG